MDTVLLDSLVILIGGFASIVTLEGWRRWSEYRALKKHFAISDHHHAGAAGACDGNREGSYLPTAGEGGEASADHSVAPYRRHFSCVPLQVAQMHQ